MILAEGQVGKGKEVPSNGEVRKFSLSLSQGESWSPEVKRLATIKTIVILQ